MITLKDLKSGLLALLQQRYPPEKYNYYSNAVIENYTRPCFFTYLEQTDASQIGRNVRTNRVSFCIAILPDKVNETSMLEIVQDLRDLFGLFIQIGDRAIHVVDYDWSWIGNERNVAQVIVTLQWMDKVAYEVSAPLIGGVVIKKELEET